jgi:NADH-quinone oxidoreductase subunit J
MKFTFENILVLFFSAAAVATAIIMITRRNPIKSVLFLVVNFFCISALYLLLKAQFIAIINVIVYAGAIMVLFLFVIMLLNLQDESKLTENITYKKITAVLLAILLFSIFAVTTYFGFFNKYTVSNPSAEQLGTIQNVGKELYTSFSFPFEAVSFILVAAIVGAIVLAKKKFE